MKRSPRLQGEQGVSMILALMFLSLFGVVVAAVLTQASTGLRATPIVSDKDAKLYAADGGINFGIQTVRDSDSLCQHTQDPPTAETVGDPELDGTSNLTINGRSVQVDCTTIDGHGIGGSGGSGAGPVWVGEYGGPAGWSAVATRYGNPQWNPPGSPGRLERCGSGNTNTNTTPGTPTTITVNDGVTYTTPPNSNKKKVTSATAAFNAATDVGVTITGVKGATQVIPANTTIQAVVSPTEITLSKDITPNTNLGLTGVTLQFTRTSAPVVTNDANGVVVKWCGTAPSTGQTVTFGGTETFNAGAFAAPAATDKVSVQFSGTVHQYNTSPTNYCTRDRALYVTTAQTWTCENPSTVPIPDPQPHVVVPSAAATGTKSATCSTSTRPAVSDGVTFAAPNRRKVTSASANFTTADIGQVINGVKGTGAGSKIIDNAHIVSVESATSITIDKDTKSAQTGVTLTIGASTTHTITYYYPGKYSPANGNVPNFGGDYIYFASGVYYFEDVGYVPIGGNGAWGGALSNEQFVSPGGDCSAAMTDTAAKALCTSTCLPTDPGEGVAFIFGGQSLFDIHAPITELNRRVAGDQEASCPGGKNNCGAVTIFAWADASRPNNAVDGQPIITGNYKTFNPGLTLDRCNCAFVTDKSGQQIIFHGLTYAPFSPVDVYSNAGGPGGLDYSPFFGGVVASEIVARVDSGSLPTSLFAGGFGPNDGPTKRTIVITSTAGPGSIGGGSITSTAVIEIEVSGETKVLSWRNQ